MPAVKSALLVVDVQESFRQRPYWSDGQLPAFLDRLQALVDGARVGAIPVVQILHVEPTGPFSLESGLVRAIDGFSLNADAIFHKHRHSALAGTGLSIWLTQRGIEHLIVSGVRTEQCCETTARHASDSGYAVDFVSEATLTFAMTDRNNRRWSADDIKSRTELVLDGRFARIATVEQALAFADGRGGIGNMAA